jgi:hypothetical protein
LPILQPIDCARLAYTAQGVPTERYETTVMPTAAASSADTSTFSAQRLAESFDAGDFVDRGLDNREIEAIGGHSEQQN